MSAPLPLFQVVFDQIKTLTGPSHLRVTAVRRLALLVTGLLAAQHSALARMAAALESLELTAAHEPAHIERRLRRALNDARLEPQRCYEPLAAQVVAQAATEADGTPLVIAIDESSQDDRVHLFRASLTYRGGSLPLVWAVWEQNRVLRRGQYWRKVDRVLRRLAALLPRGVAVVIVADRAFDIPPFLDRLRRRHWHYVIRAKAASDLRVQDHQGREWTLRELTRRSLPAPGTRWKQAGRLFKRAGWRSASLIGCWAVGQQEPLVVLTDLRPRWDLLACYGQRFWIEAGFRSDKTQGWQWEASRVQGLGHQERLLLAMAWASLLTLTLGAQVAQERLTALAQRRVPPRGIGQPRPTRESLFTLGLRRAQRYRDRTRSLTLDWRLPQPTAPSWFSQWRQAQSYRYIFQTVRP
jgi:hypothetical protein